MSKRRHAHDQILVDSGRPFPIKLNESNVQPRLISHAEPVYLTDLIALRQNTPAGERGTYTSTQSGKMMKTEVQQGAGVVDDAVKYLRNKAGDGVEYLGTQGVDVVSDLAKGVVKNASKKIRGGSSVLYNKPARPSQRTFTAVLEGGNIFRKIASGGIRLIGNTVADAFGGGKHKRRVVQKVYIEGNGIFSKLASGGIRFLGNTIADAVGGGIFAPGLNR